MTKLSYEGTPGEAKGEMLHRDFTAKEMFEKLGYEYKEYNYGKKNKMSNGIQYRKNKKLQEEIEKCGIFTEKIIEFYFYHKTLELYQIHHFSDGIKTEGTTFILKLEELQAINKQVEELRWFNE